jgi:thioredoxin-related protein
MKKLVLVVLLLSFSSVSFAKDLQWKNFNDGIAEAKKSGKKVLIDVYTDWCTWCKKMDAVTYTDTKVKAYLEKNYVLIKLNAEGAGNIMYAGKSISPAAFAQQMGVDGYPATLFLKGNGDPITILPGYSEPKMFIHVISYIAENQIGKRKFEDYLSEKGVK